MTVFPDCVVPQNGDSQHSGVPFEDAMTKTGFGKFNIIATLFCGFMLLGMILETLGFSYVIPASQCDLELNIGLKGWIAAIPFIGIILTSHLWGYLADTKGRKKILFICMLIGSIFSIISSFAPNLITFVVLRFITALFGSGPSAIGYTYLGELNPAKQRDRMLTLGNASVAFGTAIVPLMAWGILPLNFTFNVGFLEHGYRTWRLLVACFAIPYFISAIIIIFFPESPKFLLAQGKEEESLKILQRIYSVNTGDSSANFKVVQLASEPNANGSEKMTFWKKVWEQTAPLLRKQYLKYSLVVSLLQFASFSVANGYYIWYPAILDKLLNGDGEGLNICDSINKHPESVEENYSNSTIPCDDTLQTETFTISILLALVVSLVTVSAAFTINTIGKRNILVGTYAFVGLSLFVIHWMTHPILSIIAFSIIQICGINIGITNAYIVEIYPTNVRAMAVCLSMMMGRIGSITGTKLIGYLIENVCPASFFSFSILLFVSALTSFIYLK